MYKKYKKYVNIALCSMALLCVTSAMDVKPGQTFDLENKTQEHKLDTEHSQILSANKSTDKINARTSNNSQTLKSSKDQVKGKVKSKVNLSSQGKYKVSELDNNIPGAQANASSNVSGKTFFSMSNWAVLTALGIATAGAIMSIVSLVKADNNDKDINVQISLALASRDQTISDLQKVIAVIMSNLTAVSAIAQQGYQHIDTLRNNAFGNEDYTHDDSLAKRMSDFETLFHAVNTANIAEMLTDVTDFLARLEVLGNQIDNVATNTGVPSNETIETPLADQIINVATNTGVPSDETIETPLVTQISTLQSIISDVEGSIDTLQSTISDLEGQVGNVATNTGVPSDETIETPLVTQISTLQSIISDVEGSIDTLQSTISDLEGQVGNLTTNIGLPSDETIDTPLATQIGTIMNQIITAIHHLSFNTGVPLASTIETPLATQISTLATSASNSNPTFTVIAHAAGSVCSKFYNTLYDAGCIVNETDLTTQYTDNLSTNCSSLNPTWIDYNYDIRQLEIKVGTSNGDNNGDGIITSSPCMNIGVDHISFFYNSAGIVVGYDWEIFSECPIATLPNEQIFGQCNSDLSTSHVQYNIYTSGTCANYYNAILNAGCLASTPTNTTNDYTFSSCTLPAQMTSALHTTAQIVLRGISMRRMVDGTMYNTWNCDDSIYANDTYYARSTCVFTVNSNVPSGQCTTEHTTYS